MTVPTTPGNYRVDWKMIDAKGNFCFPNQQPIYIDIEVVRKKAKTPQKNSSIGIRARHSVAKWGPWQQGEYHRLFDARPPRGRDAHSKDSVWVPDAVNHQQYWRTFSDDPSSFHSWYWDYDIVR
jgi:hypothetical protein